jgi:hypothetical protein
LSEEDTPLDSPKPPPVWGKEEKKTIVEQSRKASLFVVIEK